MKVSCALSFALALFPALQVSASPFTTGRILKNNKAAGNANAGAAKGADNNGAQTSLTLETSVLCTGCKQDGQNPPVAGQVASLTSSNNFINFCATVPNLSITNGLQVQGGSCNPIPMGVIPSVSNMPSAKFVFPPNGGSVPANKAFTVKLAISNMQTGLFTNAQKNYFSAPQQLNSAGQVAGHSHVTIEQMSSLDQTTTTNPQKFAFFKGFNDAAVGGVLSTAVTAGLPAGVYRMCSINTAANHQPILVPIAQHGFLDDCVYFTSTADGAAPAKGSGAAPPKGSGAAPPKGNGAAPPKGSGANSSATPAASPPPAAGGKKGKGKGKHRKQGGN
jgi:hypothetical protein